MATTRLGNVETCLRHSSPIATLLVIHASDQHTYFCGSRMTLLDITFSCPYPEFVSKMDQWPETMVSNVLCRASIPWILTDDGSAIRLARMWRCHFAQLPALQPLHALTIAMSWQASNSSSLTGYFSGRHYCCIAAPRVTRERCSTRLTFGRVKYLVSASL